MRCRLMRGWHSAALFLTLLVVFACHLHEVYLYKLPFGKLTWQWKTLWKMYSLLKMGMFHCYLSLPEVRCHFVRWCLSLGIAGGIATFDEIIWPTLSTWNCQTCLTHFYDSTRYFLVPTKLHVVFPVSTMKTHTQTHYLWIYTQMTPDAQCLPVFPYIYPQDNPPNLYANKILTIWVYWIYIYIYFSLAVLAPLLWTNLKVMPKLWMPYVTELPGFLLPRAKEAKRALARASCGGWAMMIRPGPEDDQLFAPGGISIRKQQKNNNKRGSLRVRKSLKTPG